jgi:hypothetical protein
MSHHKPQHKFHGGAIWLYVNVEFSSLLSDTVTSVKSSAGYSGAVPEDRVICPESDFFTSGKGNVPGKLQQLKIFPSRANIQWPM